MKPARHFKVVGGKDVGDRAPPNQSVIDFLEEALEIARGGVIQSIAMIGITNEGTMVNGWSETDSAFAMLGAMTQTTTDYQNRELEQYQPDIRGK